MKKILFAAVAALAITSCSQNEEFENPNQKAEINFSTIVSKATRASELVTDGLKTNGGYKVYAYNTGKDDMGTGINLSSSAFMDDVAVTWNTTDSKWEMSGGPYYWPLEDKIQFFAYSPATTVTYKKPTAAGYPSFDYTIAEVANQEDLVVAYTKNQTKEKANKGVVALTFKHVLAQINFKLKAKDPDFTYSVDSIVLSNIPNKATFTYGAAPETTIGTWGSPSGTASYKYVADYPNNLTSDADVELKKADNALMLMPQTLGADAKIVIGYSVTNTASGATVFDSTKEVSLKDIVWNAGDKILYTLSLPSGAEKLGFTYEVVGWNTEKTPEANEAQ